MTSANDALAGAALAAALFLATTAAAAPSSTNAFDYRHDLAEALQKSDSPRDWALGSQLLETQPPTGAHLRERLAILQRAARAAPEDRVAQGLWAYIAADPHCRARVACGNPAALSRLDPDNGAAWQPVIDRAWRSGGSRATDAAIAGMAGRARYNEHLGESIAAWRDVLRRHPRPGNGDAETENGKDAAFVFDAAVETAIPPIASLFDACRKAKHPEAGAKRFGDCGRIARLMMNRSQTLLGRGFGVALLRASRSGTPADVERVRTVTWQLEQAQKFGPAFDRDPVSRQNYMSLIQASDSEMAALQYEFTLFGLALTPPADWKQTVNGKPVEPLDDVLDQP